MREFQERRRMRLFLHSRYAIVVLGLVCLLLAKGVWGVYQKYQRSEELAARTSAELAELEARQKSLIQLNAAITTEQGKEREIRDRFGLIKDGEKTAIIFDNTSDLAGASDAHRQGLWQRFIDLFR
jgi:cell division protein FtsB